ncbi:hypothetical protein [Amycolatopsis sp. NBC_00438]|uniref:hypothetical protein n=1 Tax=Amycolatopsis sp. NBC_00438 TaxID=2903558 RepID=UPI002E1B5777
MVTVRGREAGYVDISDCAELPRSRRVDPMTGVIELTIGEVAVLDRNFHADVERLWRTIADLVAQYRREGRAETGLWDEFGVLRLEPVPGGLVRFTLAFDSGLSRTAVAVEEDLLAALAFGGVEFFEKLGQLAGGFHDQDIEKLTGRSGAGRRGPSA